MIAWLTQSQASLVPRSSNEVMLARHFPLKVDKSTITTWNDFAKSLSNKDVSPEKFRIDIVGEDGQLTTVEETNYEKSLKKVLN
jgi:hypothetical protein